MYAISQREVAGIKKKGKKRKAKGQDKTPQTAGSSIRIRLL